MVKKWEEFYDNGYDLEYLIKNITCHLELFKSILEKGSKKVLEVGSGTGSMSVFLSYLGLDVTSLDSDRKVLAKARDIAEKLNGKVNFVLGDAFKLPFADNSFDIVFHQGFLEHFSDKEITQLLDEQLRVGKVVVFSVPNSFYPKKDFGDERLMSKNYWEGILKNKYRVLQSLEYNPFTKTLFGGRFVLKIRNTMYLAKLVKKHP